MKLGITMLIHNKDNIQFVTEFPCFLGHSVHEVLDAGLLKKLVTFYNNIWIYFYKSLKLQTSQQLSFCTDQ